VRPPSRGQPIRARQARRPRGRRSRQEPPGSPGAEEVAGRSWVERGRSERSAEWPAARVPCGCRPFAVPRAPSPGGETSVASEAEASAPPRGSPRRPARPRGEAPAEVPPPQAVGTLPEGPALPLSEAPPERAPPPGPGHSRRSAPPPSHHALSTARDEPTATDAWLPSADRPPRPSLLRGVRQPRGVARRAWERSAVGAGARLLGTEPPPPQWGLQRRGQARARAFETTICRGTPSSAPPRWSRRPVPLPVPKVPPGAWPFAARCPQGSAGWAFAPRPAMGVNRPRPCPAPCECSATTGERGWAVRLPAPAERVPV
jgi:hypothetical protein